MKIYVYIFTIMKNIIIILISIFTLITTAYPDFNTEIWNGLQLNHPTYSSVASTIGRIRFNGMLNTFQKNIDFNFRLAISYGKDYFGSQSQMTPANDIAGDSKTLKLDTAYFSFKYSRLKIFVGLIDLISVNNYNGFFNIHYTGNENDGFFSTHFLRLLANNGLDNYYYQSIPAVVFNIDVLRNVMLKFSVTSGLSTTHLFVRNSFPVELEFDNKDIHLSLNSGFVDADTSGVHKVSPSFGVIFEKYIMSKFYFFTKYSRVEKDIKTFRTPDIVITDNYKVAEEFSPFKEHIALGIAKHKKDFGFGIGYSSLKSFGKSLPEQIIEIFVRTKAFKIFEFSPDFQYILNPDGGDRFKYMWIAGIRFYIKL